MQKLISVIHKRPAMPAEVVTIDSTLEALRALLDGGYLVGFVSRPKSMATWTTRAS